MRPPAPILVVSPDTTSLQALTRAFMRAGLPVVPALGWLEVESWLRRIPVSLVVSDIEELSSEELNRLHRLRSEFPNIAVIALVSFSTPEVSTAETQGLVSAVLEKPIGLECLEETVRSALCPSGPGGRGESA